MKKLILSLLAIGSFVSVQAQIYTATSGEVKFFSEAPLENIEALNTEGKSLINLEKKEIAVVMGIKAFHFDKALMEEHFNENYMESTKFPTATFKGVINEDVDFTKNGTYDVTATGKLNIHGVEKDRTINGKLTVKDSKITIETKFPVALKDHGVKIPNTVIQNIAEVVDVTAKMNYELKK